MAKNVLVAVAWPYVNGDLHIGHLAGYLLPADICARYNRAVGNNVLMVSGSDCFGTPITVEADKKGVSPVEIVNEYHAKDVELFTEIAKLSYDLYTLTNHENHIKTTQEFFLKFLEQDLIFVDTQKQYFSPTENRFLPDRYVVGECPHCGFKDSRSDQCDNCGKLLSQGELIHPLSNISKEPVDIRETEHYFVDWAKLQERIKKFVDEKSPLWKDWISQETYGWLEEGLKPRAITRDLDWGVPIPVDRMPEDKIIKNVESKRIYVWFDAVIGYFSASLLWAKNNNTDWKPFWYGKDIKHYYFMGKDNLVFHTIFWPGQLMVYDPKLHLPDVASINMFLNNEGKQFSKSRGWTIPIKDMIEKYGNDAIRFYLTLIMPEVRDSSYSPVDFIEKNNGVLVATLGNFIHRVLSIVKHLSFNEVQPNVSVETKDVIKKAFSDSREYLEKCEFRNYLSVILDIASYGNSVVDKVKLWELKKTDEKKFSEEAFELMLLILSLKIIMTPLMPEASDNLNKLLGLNSNDESTRWPESGKEFEYLQKLLKSVKFSSEIKPLFRKIEVAE